jgi:transcription elongation factor
MERIRTLYARSWRAASRAPINAKSVTVEKRDAATHAGEGDGIAVERLLRRGGRPERERQSRA